MMRGETVYVGDTAVDNVIVRPGEHLEETGIDVPAGVIIAYTLAFPMSYQGSISGEKITVRGHVCDTVGFSDHTRPQDVFEGHWIEELCPWDMAVAVKLREGDMTVSIVVSSTSVSYGSDGKPIRTATQAYSGYAQARRADGSEDAVGDGSKQSVESWRFIVPWQQAFAALRPECAKVTMGGVDYDVTGIDNLSQKSEYALFEAVRRG